MNLKPASASFLALLGPVTVLQAHAEIYMTEAEAVQHLLPGDKAEAKEIELTPEETEKIQTLSGEKVRSKKMKIWKGRQGVVFIDQVLGKHEFITFAVGVGADGKATGIEIIEYRESYGSQVRKPEWRQQFVGKDASSKLKLEDDIKNISGATLSSAHVTAGVRRILKTYDLIHARI